jgi:hypothetical protein
MDQILIASKILLLRDDNGPPGSGMARPTDNASKDSVVKKLTAVQLQLGLIRKAPYGI